MAAWKVGEPLELRTERFVLRSIQPEDVTERLHGWITDADLMANLGGAWTSPDVEALRQSIEELYNNKSDFMLGVFDGELLIGCYWIEGSLRNRTACTHHVLGDKAYWGKGVPLECRAALLDWLFRVGFERIEGRPYAHCIRAIRGYMKQGWHLEGVARRASRDRSGQRHDNLLFAMLPEDWRVLRQRQRQQQAAAAEQAAGGPAETAPAETAPAEAKRAGDAT